MKADPTEDRPSFIVAGFQVARPAGKCQLRNTWRMWGFETPKQYKLPVRIAAPCTWSLGWSWTKVLQHVALHLQVGAVTQTTRDWPVQNAFARVSSRTNAGTAKRRRRVMFRWMYGGPGRGFASGAVRCCRTFPQAAPSGAAIRSTGLYDQYVVAFSGSEFSRTPVLSALTHAPVKTNNDQ